MIKRLLAVTSCKGGVGKSTVAINLAYALADSGFSVGLFDADIHGPSIPSLIQPTDDVLRLSDTGHHVAPLSYRGVEFMSFGYMHQLWRRSVEEGVVMKGPMSTRLVLALLNSTAWPDLDVLLIDFPPGTGDLPLSLVQESPIDGAVVVSTPHELSVVDTLKGVEMLHQENVPILAVVQNMSSFTCDNCDQVHYPFGKGNLESLMQAASVEDCGFHLPIKTAVDSGQDEYAAIATHVSASLFKADSQSHGGHTLPFSKLYKRKESHHWPSMMEMASLQLGYT